MYSVLDALDYIVIFDNSRFSLANVTLAMQCAPIVIRERLARWVGWMGRRGRCLDSWQDQAVKVLPGRYRYLHVLVLVSQQSSCSFWLVLVPAGWRPTTNGHLPHCPNCQGYSFHTVPTLNRLCSLSKRCVCVHIHIHTALLYCTTSSKFIISQQFLH